MIWSVCYDFHCQFLWKQKKIYFLKNNFFITKKNILICNKFFSLNGAKNQQIQKIWNLSFDFLQLLQKNVKSYVAHNQPTITFYRTSKTMWKWSLNTLLIITKKDRWARWALDNRYNRIWHCSWKYHTHSETQL
jgi:hypothetical protein